MIAVFVFLALLSTPVNNWHTESRRDALKYRLCVDVPIGPPARIGVRRPRLQVQVKLGDTAAAAVRRACERPRGRELCASAMGVDGALLGSRIPSSFLPVEWIVYVAHQRHLNGFHRHEVRAAIRRLLQPAKPPRTKQERAPVRLVTHWSCESATEAAGQAMPATPAVAWRGAVPEGAHAVHTSAALEAGRAAGWIRLPFNLLDVLSQGGDQLDFYLGKAMLDVFMLGTGSLSTMLSLAAGTSRGKSAASAPSVTTARVGDILASLAVARTARQGVFVVPRLRHRDLMRSSLTASLRRRGMQVVVVPAMSMSALANMGTSSEPKLKPELYTELVSESGAHLATDHYVHVFAFQNGNGLGSRATPNVDIGAVEAALQHFSSLDTSSSADTASHPTKSETSVLLPGCPRSLPPMVVLNLDRRPERWQRFLRRASQSGLSLSVARSESDGQDEPVASVDEVQPDDGQVPVAPCHTVPWPAERFAAIDGRQALRRIAAGGARNAASMMRRMLSPRVHAWRYGRGSMHNESSGVTGVPVFNPHTDHAFRPGVVGCALSHLHMWLRLACGWIRTKRQPLAELLSAFRNGTCSENGRGDGESDEADVVIVLEDDAVPARQLVRQWHSLQQRYLSSPINTVEGRPQHESTRRNAHGQVLGSWDVVFLGMHDDRELYADERVSERHMATASVSDGGSSVHERESGDSNRQGGVKLMRLVRGPRSFGGGTFGYALHRDGARLFARTALAHGLLQPVDWFMLEQLNAPAASDANASTTRTRKLRAFRCSPPLIRSPDSMGGGDRHAGLQAPARADTRPPSDVREPVSSASLQLMWAAATGLSGPARPRLVVLQPGEGDIVALGPRPVADPEVAEGIARVGGNVGLQATDVLTIAGAGGSETLEVVMKLKIGIELATMATVDTVVTGTVGLAGNDASIRLRQVEMQEQFTAHHRDTRLCLHLGSLTSTNGQAATRAVDSEYCLVLLDAADADVPVHIPRSVFDASAPSMGVDAEYEVLLHASAVDVMGIVIATSSQRIVLRAALQDGDNFHKGGDVAAEQGRGSVAGRSAELRKRVTNNLRAIVDGRETVLPLPLLPCTRSHAAEAIAVADEFCRQQAISQGDCEDLQRTLQQHMIGHCKV